MKQVRGVTDMALLAFNTDGGSFEARIDGERYTMKNYARVKGYRQDMLEDFLHRWHDPGRSYFVYGGHGMGDYLELEANKLALQAWELASIFNGRRFEAILFDACFMANLDCAYHLRHNTRYIGACEGYMWEPDSCLDHHIFNKNTASVMSRYKDPKRILETIQRDYCTKAARGDFAVLDTTHAAELRQFVQAHVMQRVYDRASFYSAPQQQRLGELASKAVGQCNTLFGPAGGEGFVEGEESGRHTPTTLSADSIAMANVGRISRKQRLTQAVQFEHSLYPSEVPDKHLIDLYAYLVDMAREECAAAPAGGARDGAKHGGSDVVTASSSSSSGPISRAWRVDAHGSYPSAWCADTSIVLPASFSSTESGVLRKGSALEGLDLFHKVVLSHTKPAAVQLYSSYLGGLSATVHEYSSLSKPAEPWVVDKRIFNRRARDFLHTGSLAEVEMSEPTLEARNSGGTAIHVANTASSYGENTSLIMTSAPANAGATVSESSATAAQSSIPPGATLTVVGPPPAPSSHQASV